MTTSTRTNVTYSTTSTVTDSNLRALLQPFYATLDDIGYFPRSADTGQLNPATVTYSSMSSVLTDEAVFDMRYLDDDLHATAPIYLKTCWTRQGSALQVNLVLGTATDGAGNFVGSSFRVSRGQSNISSATGITGATGGEGYAGVFSNLASSTKSNFAHFGFFLCRTTDAAGEPNSDGVLLYEWDSGRALLCHRLLNGTWTIRTYADYAFIPGARTTSHAPSEALNVYRHWYPNPEPKINPYCLTVHASEVAHGSTFTADPIVGQTREFMRVSVFDASTTAPTTSVLAVPWS